MSVEELEKIVKQLEQIQMYYGIAGVLTFILLVIFFIGLWKFFVKRTEKLAEEITDRNLKVFQSNLDKELHRFSTKHQKQIDAVHECYQRFQELQFFITFLVEGDKFTAPIESNEEVKLLTSYRLNFKLSYHKNKILLPISLNTKVDTLLPEIDKFIDEYINGLMPIASEEHIPEEERNEYQIVGLWAVGTIDCALEKMKEVSREIEAEFRRIYGTDDN